MLLHYYHQKRCLKALHINIDYLKLIYIFVIDA